MPARPPGRSRRHARPPSRSTSSASIADVGWSSPSPLAAFALLVFAMGELGFFDGKLLAGMGRLAEIAGLMLPPDPKDWAHVAHLLVGAA